MTFPKSVLFVCLGNICRSPSAEAVMTQKAHAKNLTITFDSAGTANYHVGEAPDVRAIDTGKKRGYDLTALNARQICQQDFYDFELILAMDTDNLRQLKALMPNNATAQLHLFDKTSVADPYYGTAGDFDAMFTHIERASESWLHLWLAGSL